jgi:hypothetical protein
MFQYISLSIFISESNKNHDWCLITGAIRVNLSTHYLNVLDSKVMKYTMLKNYNQGLCYFSTKGLVVWTIIILLSTPEGTVLL